MEISATVTTEGSGITSLLKSGNLHHKVILLILKVNQCSMVLETDRADCAYPGINKDQCEAAGCCWVESHTNSPVPWCFNKISCF